MGIEKSKYDNESNVTLENTWRNTAISVHTHTHTHTAEWWEGKGNPSWTRSGITEVQE